MTQRQERELARLRARVDDALRRDRPRRELEPMLVRLLELAGEDGEDALFCHRNLAELYLEERPWVASLHLRRVTRGAPSDDMAHALMGLAQALLGNFEAAVAAYMRALALAPSNPWYHHNVGHLLDVALDLPARALVHLRKAHEAQPIEDEVTASLAHCLARCGELSEAEMYATEAVELAPDHEEHRGLLYWIRDGAPGDGLLRVGPALGGRAPRVERNGGQAKRGPARRRRKRSADDAAVIRALERHLPPAARNAGMLSSAQLMWDDYRVQCPKLRVHKPEICAAAVEYALSRVWGLSGVTQATIARRYSVSAGAVSHRYGEINRALALRANDARYMPG